MYNNHNNDNDNDDEHNAKVVAASSQAKRVLEIGSFCGVAALALADALPEGQVHAIEIDPFVVKLGERFRNKSMCGRHITTHVGPAMEKLQTLAQEVRAGKLEPFDFVVVDADKAGMRGVHMYTHICIIYIYIYREREIDR